jgi:hypothetical protein
MAGAEVPGADLDSDEPNGMAWDFMRQKQSHK